MTNAELIAALRICGNYADRDGCDEACPYYNDNDCPKRIMCDAADALEAAEKRIADLEADKKTLINVLKDKSDFHATKDAMRIAELEAQLPKEGEWIDIDGTMFAECSVCGKRHYGCNTPYCDMCGARMRGKETDDGIHVRE